MKNLLNPLRVAWLALWAAVATLVLAVPIIAAGLLSRTGNLAFTLSKLWAYTMLAVSFVRVEIKNKEKIQKGTSYIIISNHQSHFDILALVTTLGIQYRWFIKREVLMLPLFGYGLYASRNIFIDRSDTARAIESINKGIRRLPKGVSVMVFAEGTRSPDGRIHEFKKGGFMVAVAHKMPILPVTVSGSRQVMPKGSLVFSPGKIRVVVGAPIDTRDYSIEKVDKLIAKTRQVIMDNFDAGK
ncbi:MAG TPA: lysophospholipid acyltransferase family protein [Smithellaceae bacterium]|nr:lysophospholipid acyltransferase family protein [Smithellaceae bacterium]HRS90353.1 lysophospholipid acyltransferase family protein [Smithellaceae bacterium]HRV27087.1 lysophospholipid acyltransferase family protein [Smithellaceae bacterium]